ncbi:AAA family ATPase [Geminicoccus roseus]|uniref:AAA family ATPase n=1 Tax=Geminicoccus roseus TaxID=404900 RepID=UPI00040B44D3|nr:cellulose synthase operon protein YhjQ/BcsQ [Geminicoccus roseus]
MLSLPFGTAPRSTSQDPVELAAFLSDSESCSVIEQLDQEHRNFRHHVRQGRVAEAVEYLKTVKTPPKILIVDISGLELPLSEIDRLADVCEPSIRVLVVGNRQDVGLFRSLLKLGIADYILKPLSPALIEPHLDGSPLPVLGAASTRSGKLVVVTGTCGGVGATTIGVNLGWHLAIRDHRRVALVDMDMHGQAMALQLDVRSSDGLLRAIENSSQIDSQFIDNAMTSYHPRLGILTGELLWDQSADIRAEQLDDVIKILEHHHHYVIVDLPRRPGPVYTYLLRRAALRVVVTNRSLTATRDCGRLLELSGSFDGRTILVLNEDRPATAGMLAVDAIETSLQRKFDLRIAHERRATAQIDSAARSQPLAAANRPFRLTVEALAASISGRSISPRSRWHRFMRRS